MTKKEHVFGSWNVAAELAASLGEDPRPHMSEQDIEHQLKLTGMTREQWDQAWEEKIEAANRVPF